MHPTSNHIGNDVEVTDTPIKQKNMKEMMSSNDDISHNINGLSNNGTEKKSYRKQNGKNGCNGTNLTSYLNNEESNLNNGNGYQNGSNNRRRNSANVWSPLLQSTNDCGNVGIGSGSCVTSGLSDQTEEALFGSASNNNEWKDAEKINNFKNGFLHHNNRHNHTHLPQCNNNGLLINGKKNGTINITDKYDEQDPLTGLYKQKNHHHQELSNNSDDSVYTDNINLSNNCGLFGCRPKWARNFASTHVFMVIFLLAYILQGMYMTYFVSVITTIEKLFQIKSKTTGLLLSASEMGQISTAMLLTYFAGRGHRPRWIACGMVLFSIAAFSCSLPHFIFGEQLMQSTNILNSNNDIKTNGNYYNSSSQILNSMSLINEHNLCLTESNSKEFISECNENRKLEQASHSKITVIVLCIFFASLLSSGIGQTAVATLGIPYIDDNVASKQSPIYMAITIGVRILGPASGFIVGSMCTRWYVNFSDPGFDANDPRWIGAWWLGPVIIGSLMLMASIAMFSFPKQLSGRRIQPKSITNGVTKEIKIPTAAATTTNERTETSANVVVVVEETPKLKDFPKTVRRQLKNDILMFRTASCVFHLLPIAGLYTFLPKYLETQFYLAAYDANMVAAFCGILVMGFGIVVSGIVILKLKPTARSVAAWIAFTALFYSAGMVVLMFVGCNMNDFAGFPTTDTSNSKQLMFEPTCKLNCTCDIETFTPICGEDGKTYFSSCHAGCTMSELRSTDNRTVFKNCSCISDYSNSGRQYDAVSGYCDRNCKNFIYFILIFAICVFMHSTSEVGSMLVVMRCTHPKDKAMAMGVIQSAIGLFGNVPCPIIYGAVVDSACLIWKTVCGKHGACSLYDVDTFRHYFLGITASIMFLAFIMDLVVWSKAHRIDIAPHDDEKMKTECEKSGSSPDTTV